MMKPMVAAEVLHDYFLVKRFIEEQRQRERSLHDLLTAHIEATGEEVYDPIFHLTATLKTRRKADSYDLASMPDELVLWAAKHFILNADDKLVHKLMDKAIEAVEMRKYATPGGETTALVLREAGEKEQA